MSNNNINYDDEDLDLLSLFSTSCLTKEDVKWLKNKWWFKRFLKIYVKELKIRYGNREIKKIIYSSREERKKEETNLKGKNIQSNKEIEKQKIINKKEELETLKLEYTDEIEMLDFTKTLSIPTEELQEILEVTKTMDLKEIPEVAKIIDETSTKVKREKLIWSIILGISLFVLIILIVITLNYNFEENKTDNISDEIYEVAEINEIPVEENSIVIENVEDNYKYYQGLSMLDVNFDNLKQINDNTVGWLMVPGTDVNYPFVQHTNNEYYLKHSYDKSGNNKGWVFLDYRNDIEYLNKNNIIYAHGLNNNQMFGSLRNIVNSNWYSNKNNHIIKISTPYNNQLWQVFSTYTIEPETYYITTYFKSNDEFEEFISTIKKRSVYNYGISVSVKDKILTLSSCYNKQKRMVLHAKLVSLQSK